MAKSSMMKPMMPKMMTTMPKASKGSMKNTFDMVFGKAPSKKITRRPGM